MPILVSGAEAAGLTGAFGDHFDQFSNNRNIIVNKEPIKTINTNTISYPGYDEVNNTSFTYIPVSGVFPAIIVYDYKGDAYDTIVGENKMRIAGSRVKIKVREDCKEYIKNGKTQSIIVDDNVYNEVRQNQVQNFLGLKYYYFDLKSTY